MSSLSFCHLTNNIEGFLGPVCSEFRNNFRTNTTTGSCGTNDSIINNLTYMEGEERMKRTSVLVVTTMLIAVAFVVGSIGAAPAPGPAAEFDRLHVC